MRGEKIVLDVPVFTQRDAECGNTSLKSVLWHLGRRVSAVRLGRLAGLTDEGINHVGLVEAARRSGAAVFERSGGTIAELRWFLERGHPVVVGWWSMCDGDAHFDPAWSQAQRRARDCGHFSVVSGIGASRVQLMDPQAGRVWMPQSAFRRVWYDTDGDSYRKIERWYLVAHRSDERFAPQIGGGRDYS